MPSVSPTRRRPIFSLTRHRPIFSLTRRQTHFRFDVNARGRTDVPSDQPWQTALHKAAEDGNLDLAQTLLRLGADPGVRDHRFNSTPLGWARYFGHKPLIDLLEPLTPPEGTNDTNGGA